MTADDDVSSTPKEGNTDAASRSTNVPSRNTQSFADRRAEVLNKDHTSDTNSDDDADTDTSRGNIRSKSPLPPSRSIAPFSYNLFGSEDDDDEENSPLELALEAKDLEPPSPTWPPTPDYASTLPSSLYQRPWRHLSVAAWSMPCGVR